MGYSFDIELFTDEPFVIELSSQRINSQLVSGRIVLHLDKPEDFKVATVRIHGQIGIALNTEKKATIVHEHLLNMESDLVAANDSEGRGVIRFPEAGTNYIPFRIDIPRPHDLPPTLINKLDTHYIDWKYEVHATLQRSSIFSTPSVVKRDLIMRRRIVPTVETPTLSATTDMPNQFKSHLTVPSAISLGQNTLPATVEIKSSDKSFIVKEIDCAVIQTENISYFTRYEHPHVENAHEPGVPCKIEASRLVSSIKKIVNDDATLDFGQDGPVQLDVNLDNFQLIPTERGIKWLEISHVIRFTVHFVDVTMNPIITELPIFVDQESAPSEDLSMMNAAAAGAASLMSSLIIAGAEKSIPLPENEISHET
ncbi:hypothetical protein BGZ49_003662, partial [Haplosporangium sp. Z 27]